MGIHGLFQPIGASYAAPRISSCHLQRNLISMINGTLQFLVELSMGVLATLVPMETYGEREKPGFS